ncbi:MAG: hypothetical protein Q8Q39_04030 [bacterium]|nr:hypothetical protein [bacterium]
MACADQPFQNAEKFSDNLAGGIMPPGLLQTRSSSGIGLLDEV